MLKNTSIYNFKSIQKIETLKLKPLTILTGVNSSGKSNILEALSFFAQAHIADSVSLLKLSASWG
jgi:AAA15 family ATPase/GTPase